MFYVYILQSLKDPGYYIGQTENLSGRINKHNCVQVKLTRSRRPFVLIKEENFKTRSKARKRENYLKRLKGGNEFKNIIKS